MCVLASCAGVWSSNVLLCGFSHCSGAWCVGRLAWPAALGPQCEGAAGVDAGGCQEAHPVVPYRCRIPGEVLTLTPWVLEAPCWQQTSCQKGHDTCWLFVPNIADVCAVPGDASVGPTHS
jgi:hypothetical protein